MLVQIPSSWYFVCSSKELRPNKVLHKKLNGISIIVYRDNLGKPIAMKSRCVHLGADLKSATIENGNLVCPLHQWKFDSSGKCIATKMIRDKVPDARQSLFPIEEKCESIFIFLGESFFPFPKFTFESDFSFEPTQFVRLDTNWQSLASNSFDIEHLSIVHKRGLHEEPILKILNQHTMFMSYASFVQSNEFSDKIMKYLSGNRIQVRVHNYGGTFLTIESQLKKRKAVLLFSFVPEDENFIKIHTIVGVPKTFPILDTIKRKISIYLYMSFLNRDLIAIRNLRVREENLINDKYLKHYWKYLENLK